jgi:chromosome segregation ATPase
MSKSRISASINEELADWVQDHKQDISQLVEEGLNRIYQEERYGREQTLRRREQELRREIEDHEMEIEQLQKEVESISEQLEAFESIEEKQAEKLISYAVSLISTQSQYRDYQSVGSLTEQEVRKVLQEVELHYAEWRGGQRVMENVPEELREQDKSSYETGKYGEITDEEDFRDAYHKLTGEQKGQVIRLVKENF